MNDTTKRLRCMIADMVYRSGEGHIPSSFSIIDIIYFLYRDVLRYKSNNPSWDGRDHFILSKGHGAAALYVVLREFGFITDEDILNYSTNKGRLGGHPDSTIVPGAEASTGSLGHGFPFAVGVALGQKVRTKTNRTICLMGDGECHEGTIWESANVAANRQLGNLLAIVDWNNSGAQLMPIDDLPARWAAFGWNVLEVDGHSDDEMNEAIANVNFQQEGTPHVIIAHTVKGKGVSFTEGHGRWHHRIPTEEELSDIKRELS